MTCKNCGANPLVPQPYYEDVRNEVYQSHETNILSRVYAAGVRTKQAWSTPALGASVQVNLLDVIDIAVNTYLYSPSYGFYKITSWTPSTGSIQIQNDGIHGNTPGGTNVPEYTIFNIVPRPCCEDNSSTFLPFLAQDFIVPFVNTSKTIQVTSTFGLRVGELARIGSGVYKLETINSSKEIVITNLGGGGIPGSTVYALDSNGDYQWLVTYEPIFACSSGTTVDAGSVIVCSSGDQQILTGSTIGHVLSLTDPATGAAEYAELSALSLADDAVTTSKILNLNVTTAKIADDAITSAKIANNAVGTTEIANGAVTNAKIATGAVQNAQIATNAITYDKILDGQISVYKIVDGAVTNPKLANFIVDNIKLADLAAGASFTPSFDADTAVGGIMTTVGMYWNFGPICICRMSVSGVPGSSFNSPKLYFPLNTKIDGNTQNWPCMIFGNVAGSSGLHWPVLYNYSFWSLGGAATGGYANVIYETNVPSGYSYFLGVIAIFPTR